MDHSVWLLLSVLAIVIGCVLLVPMALRFINGKNKNSLDDINHKDGLPITPRDQRQLEANPISSPSEDAPDALSSMAAVASSSVANPSLVSQPADALIKTQETDKAIHQDNESLGELDDEFEYKSLSHEHLSDQNEFGQDNSPLLNATDHIAFLITPRNGFAQISGKTVLKIVREHGLKYGEMNMFHRYEDENGMGYLWFSMMGVDEEGVQAFDLLSLAESRFSGILLFLSLPHIYALRGFDSMKSVAKIIADDLDADIYHESGYLLDESEFNKLRAYAANYQ